MNHEHEKISYELYDDGIGRVELIQSTGTDETVVRSARVSFGRDGAKEELTDRDKKLINYLIKHQHTSTLEHCSLTCRITVPLFVRSQHHRHRTWKFNEISRRYTDMDLVFYEPQEFRTQHKSNRQASNPNDTINPHIHGDTVSELVKEHHEYSLSLYNDMMEAGVCREQARGILPQNLYTTYWATVDLNNLFKFICLRLHEGAQWEIQKIAEALFRMSFKLWPYTSEALANNCWDDYTRGKLQEILEEEKRYAAQMSFDFIGGC